MEVLHGLAKADDLPSPAVSGPITMCTCMQECARVLRKTRLRETGCMRGCVSMCGLHITESMTYLARHEALWVQWRDGRMGAVVRGIEVPAPTVPAARRLVLLVRHPTRGSCQVCRRHRPAFHIPTPEMHTPPQCTHVR